MFVLTTLWICLIQSWCLCWICARCSQMPVSPHTPSLIQKARMGNLFALLCATETRAVLYVWNLSRYSVSRQLPALAELMVLYVRRTCSLWKEAAVMLWLEESVKEVLCRVDASDPLVEDCQNKWDTDEALWNSIAVYISSTYSCNCVPGGSSGTRVHRGTFIVTFFCQKSKRPFQVCLLWEIYTNKNPPCVFADLILQECCGFSFFLSPYNMKYSTTNPNTTQVFLS